MAVKTKTEQGSKEVIRRSVTLRGEADIMFDRYAGDNSTKLEPWQKLYLSADRSIVLPSLNLVSFLSAQNTTSAPKRLLDKRKYRETANACLAFVLINPREIPFLRDGTPIKFDKFGADDVDRLSGCYIHRCVARLKDGIPNPKVRPVIPLPWSVKFTITIMPNREIQETQVLNLFELGGAALGLGTFRGVFGKFSVGEWIECE